MGCDLESQENIEITLDQLLDGTPYSPVTLRHLLCYVSNVRRSAEHLQFLLFVNHYGIRFEKLKNQKDKGLSDCWTPNDDKTAKDFIDSLSLQASPSTTASPQLPINEHFSQSFSSDPTWCLNRVLSTHGAAAEWIQPFDEKINISDESLVQRSAHRLEIAPWEADDSIDSKQTDESRSDSTGELDLDLFDGHPILKGYISRAIATYLIPGIGSQRQLNLSDNQRRQILYALRHSNHPNAFRIAREYARKTACCLDIPAFNKYINDNPTFVKYIRENAKPPRPRLALSLGILLTIIGLVEPIVLTCSHYHRGWRALGTLALIPGVAIWHCAERHMCLVSRVLKMEKLTPWEVELHQLQHHDGHDDDVYLELFNKVKGSRSEYFDGNIREYLREKFDIDMPKSRYGRMAVQRQGVFVGVLVDLFFLAFILALPCGKWF